MSKIMSAQGHIVDFEMMKILNAGNAPKNQSSQKRAPKFYEIPEVEIPYIESISSDQLVKEQLEKFKKMEDEKKVQPVIIQAPIVEKIIEPSPLIIQEPIVETVEELPIIPEPKEVVDLTRRKK